MDNTDIRCKQRFSQFEKAFSLLRPAIAIEQPTVFEKKFARIITHDYCNCNKPLLTK